MFDSVVAAMSAVGQLASARNASILVSQFVQAGACEEQAMIGAFAWTTFATGIDAAITAAEYLKPKTAIPMHYGTWEVIDVDPQAFVDGVEKLGVNGIVLQIGESFTLE